jgi:hypothetical protein
VRLRGAARSPQKLRGPELGTRGLHSEGFGDGRGLAAKDAVWVLEYPFQICLSSYFGDFLGFLGFLGRLAPGEIAKCVFCGAPRRVASCLYPTENQPVIYTLGPSEETGKHYW